MAVDMFLKLDGIKGEAQDSKHKGEIDITSWSWGLSQTGAFGTGGGGGTAKVSVHDASITKYVDTATCDLLLDCSNGKHIATGNVTFRKAGENPLEYMKIKLTDIIVSSVQHSGAGELTSESVSLNFAKFEIEYYQQNEDGSGTKAGNMGWDVKGNTKL